MSGGECNCDANTSYNNSKSCNCSISTKNVVILAGLAEVSLGKEVRLDVPYLGNVAVSQYNRREGIGAKLVKIGCKVAEKWQEEKTYVAVDIDNLAALKMYEKLNFQLILDESQMIFKRNKKPRMFLSKVNELSNINNQ